MRICVVAPSRFPIVEPFAGGLEAHTHGLVVGLRRRGHDVTLFAARGSDPLLGAELLDVPSLSVGPGERRDLAEPPGWWMRERHAYLTLMQHVQRSGAYDVVHNNSLHALPIAMAHTLGVPLVTTLHTPPFRQIQTAIEQAPVPADLVAVSASMSRCWAHVAPTSVVHNGVDPGLWRPGPGGTGAVWTGRLVPEKAPHEAVLAARLAGLEIDLVGPLHDTDYFRDRVQPLLSARVRYLGHLPQRSVRHVVAHAGVALVSPAWDEPFGLVVAEALATGTPVAAYDRGALGELVSSATGRMARAGDVADLARAATQARQLDRAAVAQEGVARFSLDAMVRGYERIYAELAEERAA